MVKEAEAHAADDKKRKETVEARNHADSLVHSTEKSLKEFGDKVDSSLKADVERDVAALKAVMDGDDPEAIKAKTEALMQSSMKLGEAMYKAQEAAGGAEGAAAGGHGSAGGAQDGTVVDADFEEVDGDKKGK
jgi:molecular chaperone DnaK